MSEAFNQVKVWAATRERRKGGYDYDLLAKAGLAGRVVLDNVLDQILREAYMRNIITIGEETRGNEGGIVKLSKGERNVSPNGGIEASDEIRLFIMTGEAYRTKSKQPGVSGTTVQYRLANHTFERWSLRDDTAASFIPGTTHVEGVIGGPYLFLRDKVTDDFGNSLRQTSDFVFSALGRVCDEEIEQVLSLHTEE